VLTEPLSSQHGEFLCRKWSRRPTVMERNCKQPTRVGPQAWSFGWGASN